MSIEDCRKSQRECSSSVHAEMATMRRDVNADIAAIRTAVQEIDRSVASIKGYLGINGNRFHRHQRNDDDAEREHQRATDTWQVKIMWGAGVAVAALVANRLLNILFDHVLAK